MGTEDLAYIAGLFDGEGNVGIQLRQHTGGRTVRIKVHCAITNCDFGTLS